MLLSYQRRWCADDAPIAVWEKSRRIGATWCDAADSVLTASDMSGSDVYYLGYNESMTREYIDACAKWARSLAIAAERVEDVVADDADVQTLSIRFASGHKILALSSHPRSLRGKQGKIVIDEAAHHDDLDGVLAAAVAAIMWGGRVRIMSTHFGADNPFALLVRDIRSRKLPYSLHSTTFADAISQGLHARVLAVLGPQRVPADAREWEAAVRAQYGASAPQELDCVPEAAGATYLPRYLVEQAQDATIPVLRLTRTPGYELHPDRLAETDRWIDDELMPVIARMPRAERTAVGQDFGRTGDLSYVSVLQQTSAQAWREAFALELRCVPFDVQSRVAHRMLDSLPLLHRAALDARGNGQAHAEALAQQFGAARIDCVMATRLWYGEHFARYRAALESRALTIAAGEDVIADHRRIIMRAGYPSVDDGHDRGSDGQQRHGDGAVARCLAWAAARHEEATRSWQIMW